MALTHTYGIAGTEGERCNVAADVVPCWCSMGLAHASVEERAHLVGGRDLEVVEDEHKHKQVVH